MKLIIGLGNPGRKYEFTRHNVGFMVVDALASKIRNSNIEILNKFQILNSKFQMKKKLESNMLKVNNFVLAKPQTFMNDSGRAVKKLYNNLTIKQYNNLYVVHDDLDIKLGEHKITKGKGPRVHKGLLDIYEKLGTKDFWHVRVGIENRHSEIAESISRGPVRGAKHSLFGKDYVLQRFADEEMDVVNRVIEKVTGRLLEELKKT